MHTDPTQRCDHASAAMFVIDPANRMLLIERGTAPYGYAPPAGHVFDSPDRLADDVDYDSAFALAAMHEVREETGLTVRPEDMRMVLDRWSYNRCRRTLRDGERAGHAWRVFETHVYSGLVVTSEPEVRGSVWVSPAQIEVLARRTVEFVAGQHSPAEFGRAPGLEPVWVWWLNVLGMLPNISDPDAVACSNFADRDEHGNF